MRGYLAAWASGLVLLGASCVRAQEDAPPLAGPEGSAPAELPQTLRAEPLPPPSGDAGPSLALPGGGPTTLPPPAPVGPPPLVGPAESLGSTPISMPRPAVPSGPRTLGLEPIAPGSLAEPRRGTLPGRIGEDDPDISPAPRRPRLFGRRTNPAPFRGRGDDSITIEPRSNPADDAAVKRRLEQQVRNVAGNRLRSVDVRVVDRDVVIRAKVTRFWYRRGVKRAIESMPALNGHKATVLIED
jgi:hypothetical protein